MTGPPVAPAEMTPGPHRRWRGVLLAVVTAGGVVLLAAIARSTLTGSVSAFAHIEWRWVPVAVFGEFASMTAVARIHRRLLHVSGIKLQLGSVMAVAYARNAISVSLPLAGPQLGTAFSFRQFGRQGIDPAVAGWALAMSGIISSFAFAFVLAGGAVASRNTTAAALGLAGALLSLLPTVAVLAALCCRAVRRRLNGLLARLVATSRRVTKRRGPGTENALERFLDRVASLRLRRREYVDIFALSVWNWVADCLCLAAANRCHRLTSSLGEDSSSPAGWAWPPAASVSPQAESA
jgi:putative heme transporter